MTTKTQKEIERREEHMHNAALFAQQLCHAADLRGLSGYDVVVSIASVMAARNPTLAGKVLAAVLDAINLQPITKIITDPQQAGGTLQ